MTVRSGSIFTSSSDSLVYTRLPSAPGMSGSAGTEPVSMNVRAASILGYVGAGGLGILIDERIGWRDYNGLGTVLLTLFVAVLLIENLSQFLRSKLS